MKLIDMLAQELPKCGGWPEWAHYAVKHTHLYGVCFYNETGSSPFDAKFPSVFMGYTQEGEVVTQKEYQAAIGLQKPVWNGEGLPPIGAEVEVMSQTYGWKKATVTAVTDTWIIAQYENGVEFAGTHRTFSSTRGWETNCSDFRKVKSQEELQRETTIEDLRRSLKTSGYPLSDSAAGTLLSDIAQGKVSGLKLTD